MTGKGLPGSWKPKFTYRARQVREPCRSPIGRSKQTSRTFVSWQRTPKSFPPVSLAVSPLHWANSAAPFMPITPSAAGWALPSPTGPQAAPWMGAHCFRGTFTILQLTKTYPLPSILLPRSRSS